MRRTSRSLALAIPLLALVPAVVTCGSSEDDAVAPRGGAGVAGAAAVSGSTNAGVGAGGGGTAPSAGTPSVAGANGGTPAGSGGTPSAGAATAGGGAAAGNGGSSGVPSPGAGAGGTSGGAAGSSPGGTPVVGGNGGAGGGGGGAIMAGAPSAGTGGGLASADATFCRTELDSAAQHYDRFRQAYTNPSSIPRSVEAGRVRLVGPSDWTSGFPAGSFWLLYEHTRSAAYRTAAETWTAALEGQRTRTDTHDVGFVINNTFGAGYRLTQNTRYRDVVLAAAASLASRFNQTVGATRSWNFGSWSFPVIIDNMMNLELLFDATALGGNARFREIAITHALTTRTNHFRADASSFHLVDYNPTTGAVVRKQTNQGLNDASSWARGQAWGLYGFTMSYRETQDARFLEQATLIADYYVGHPDMPADRVPYFDFDAPKLANVPDHRDASAGAIATSALLELARYATPEGAARYRAFAIQALRSFASPAYRAALGTNGHFLLMHSVGNYPIDDEIDVAINYADYYYLEALLRCSAAG